jgi:hypothetical protein
VRGTVFKLSRTSADIDEWSILANARLMYLAFAFCRIGFYGGLL